MEYHVLFDSLVFAVTDCGFEARCAKEAVDSGEVRIDKVVKIIGACRYGLHDISRTELDRVSQLPRFNMPFELGLFLGALNFGRDRQRRKLCLILDREPYRYQRFISDISGQDISVHHNKSEAAIRVVRDWLSNFMEGALVPSGSIMAERYGEFRKDLPDICRTLHLKEDELTFKEFRNLNKIWLEEHGW
jgi:hypothetical protein